ncbi:transcriptional regulator, IclR family [Tistlia consotensis]|uniref:Transcriptional regulator, IclR family n=1 Tax=Tistlia consotensis USBA 355 TaxID=560819 RepID=A0A1Y6CGM5_9PROT|nr:IclR family transcriptional regulator C-terminal domain-containing protein [Tistlia consotensis]SMF64239.1 transcriptional regulator, IclR family [Tistlia consotensis USBA 355]SNR97659.1 transcriptional regulator, IclR family [Tistlia consotensis]
MAAEPTADGVERGEGLFVASVERTMRVLEAVAANQAPIGLTEIAAATGFGKSAVQRLTHTLTSVGYLEKDPATRRYRMTVRALDLAHGFLVTDPLINEGLLHLIDASERCGETVNMGKLEGTDFIYVARLPAHRMNVAAALIGRRQPAYCASGGRAIMSLLPRQEVEALLDARPLRALTPLTTTDRGRILEIVEQARLEGFCATNQEVLLGELAVSAPISDQFGRPVGAVQSSVSTASWTLEAVREKLAPQVMEAARLISRPRLAKR